ncbi:MAG: 4-hydroxythreonine-4-phosphate dehydrogenase PdxA [Panacagrimonas sp.]
MIRKTRPETKPQRASRTRKPAARLLITPGEPAGIGPDLLIKLAQKPPRAELVAVADPDLLQRRAEALGLDLKLVPLDLDERPKFNVAGQMKFLPVPLARTERPGRLNPKNAEYVLQCLRMAADSCLAGQADAMVTGPVQKSVISDAGIAFSGHTEFLAERTGADAPLMMLVAGDLRVALATTHLPLREVPDAITRQSLTRILRLLDGDLRALFHIAKPRIRVCGLNPHAGESGHLGREEVDVIAPVIRRLKRQGLKLTGPVAADTVFTQGQLQQTDAVLALYHDQGLPVLKHAGFGEAVNLTLGLPIIRTSVDHGTALDLAASGEGDEGSLRNACQLAIELAQRALV